MAFPFPQEQWRHVSAGFWWRLQQRRLSRNYTGFPIKVVPHRGNAYPYLAAKVAPPSQSWLLYAPITARTHRTRSETVVLGSSSTSNPSRWYVRRKASCSAVASASVCHRSGSFT